MFDVWNAADGLNVTKLVALGNVKPALPATAIQRGTAQRLAWKRGYFASERANLSRRSSPFSMFARLVA